MAILKPSKSNVYKSNMLRDGLRLLLDGVSPGAAASVGFIATASLPTSGIIAMGAFDGIDLFYAGDASTTDVRVRVTGLVPVYSSDTSAITGYLEFVLNSEVAANAASTLVLGAAFGVAVGSAVVTTGYLWIRTPATSSPSAGVTVYAAEAGGIGYVRVTPGAGVSHIRVQATANTGGSKVSVFGRRLKGDSLNLS